MHATYKQTKKKHIKAKHIKSKAHIKQTLLIITCWASCCVFRQAIRINNDIEGYHNDLNTQAVIGNPPFYLLCRLVHRESSLLPLQVKLVYEGKLKRYQRKRSRYIQGRIFSFWDQYAQHQISTSTLLRRCAFVYGPTAATSSPLLTSNPCLYQGFSYEKSGFMPV